MRTIETHLCSERQIRDRLAIAAKRCALKLWPRLVIEESAKPEPNLLKPKPLTTIKELEAFCFARMLENVMRHRGSVQ